MGPERDDLIAIIDRVRNLRWEAWRKLLEIGPTNENLEHIVSYRHGKLQYEVTRKLLSNRPSNKQLRTIMIYGRHRKLILEAMEMLVASNPSVEDLNEIYHNFQLIVPLSRRQRRLKHEAWEKLKNNPESGLDSLHRIKLF